MFEDRYLKKVSTPVEQLNIQKAQSQMEFICLNIANLICNTFMISVGSICLFIPPILLAWLVMPHSKENVVFFSALSVYYVSVVVMSYQMKPQIIQHYRNLTTESPGIVESSRLPAIRNVNAEYRWKLLAFFSASMSGIFVTYLALFY